MSSSTGTKYPLYISFYRTSAMALGEWIWKGPTWLLALGIMEDSAKTLGCRPVPWCGKKALGTALKQEIQFVLLTR